MNIGNAIKFFSEFLNINWGSIRKWLEVKEGYSLNDWLQCNWEILVEQRVLPVGEYLEIYGEGADLNGIYSRITFFDALPTYYINVLVKNSIDVLNNEKIKNESFNFEELIGFKDGFYDFNCPFAYVLVKDKNDFERVFLLEDVKFELRTTGK